MRPDRLSSPSISIASPADAPDRFTLGRVMCAGICALVLCIGIARFAYTPLLPVMRDQTHLSGIGAGWLATLNYVGYLVGALIASTIPSVQRKFVLYRIGLVVAAVSTVAMGLTTNMPVWIALRLVSGVSGIAGPLLGAGLTLNWLLRHGHRPNLGIYYSGVGLGIVVSGAVAAAMSAGALAWSAQWMAFGVFGLAFLVPAWIWMPPPAATTAATTRAAPIATPPSPAWMARFHVAYFAGGLVFVVTATYIVDIVKHMESIALPGTAIWIIMGAIAIPSCFAWDKVAETIGSLRALTLAYGLQTLSCAMIAVADHPAPILVAAVLYGGTVMGIVSLTLSIVGRLYPRDPARAMARLTLSYGTAQIIGPIAAAYVAHGSGYSHALLLAALVGAGGTAVSLLLRPPDIAPTVARV